MTKAKRRQYGSGGLYQRSDGRWYGSIVVGYYPNGGMRRVTVSAKTQAEAKAKLEAKRRQISRDGIPAPTVSSRTTVRAWSQTWLEDHQQRVRPRTFAADAGPVKNWIVPIIGGVALTDLTPDHVRQVTRAILAAGRTSTTARYAQGVLMRMLKAAVLEGYVVPERVRLTPAPPRAVNDRDAIAFPDALALLKAASEDPAGSRWVAALLQGMRQGECLGLTWSCVNLGAGTLDVSWQLQQLKYADRAAGTFNVPANFECRQVHLSLHLVRPKSSAGHRVIPLVPWMTAALREWREVAPYSPAGLVWPSPTGAPRQRSADDRAWYDLQDAAQVAKVDGAAGRRYLIHEARHTTATLLLEGGVDPHVVTAIMGHSSILTSRGYQHVSSALARRAMEDVAERLGLTAG